MDLRKLLTRTVSGLIYCLIIVAAIFAGYWGVATLGCLFGLLACIEFAKISHELNTIELPTIIADIAGCMSLALIPVEPLLAFAWILIIMGRMILQLYIKSMHPLKDLAHSMMSQIWIGGPMLVMSMIAVFWDPKILLAMFLFIWINDTGAFLVGSLLGKHRLFERISPKKSWEGFFGGLVFNLGFAVLFYYTGNKFFGMEQMHAGLGVWLGMAAVVTIFGTWGDLLESLIKRNLNIKDSGNLIPGHGGILDRIDSLLMVLPAVFIYLCLCLFCPVA